MKSLLLLLLLLRSRFARDLAQTPRRLTLSAVMAGIWLSGTLPGMAGGVITQNFPAFGADGGLQTRWRIEWDVVSHGGGSEVLAIKSAWFSRGQGLPEIQVLGGCRLAEIFVPYNNGGDIHDISGYNFSMIDIPPNLLGPSCVSPPRLFRRDGTLSETNGVMAAEVHDDHLRWLTSRNAGRRGQIMTLWSVLDAANYRYIMLYGFTDDGQIHCRLGATANNLNDGSVDDNVHLHMGCWRLEPVLGSAGANTLDMIEHCAAGSLRATGERAVTREGGYAWRAEGFARLRITNAMNNNGHRPQPSLISYELTPSVRGVGRFHGGEDGFTGNDFWVTRGDASEDVPVNLPGYANGEELRGPVVIWHNAALMHSPRDEDFGPDGHEASEGAALTAWAGFELKPRNFFRSTPFLPERAAPAAKNAPLPPSRPAAARPGKAAPGPAPVKPDGEKAAVNTTSVVYRVRERAHPRAGQAAVANARGITVLRAAGEPRAAAVWGRLKTWNPGQTLNVAFLGGDAALHAQIETVARQWLQHGNLQLNFRGADGASRTWSHQDAIANAAIRISFDRPGYYSLVGTEAIGPAIPPGEETMNFENFHLGLPPDWAATVLHEFGHAFGMEHEHQHPAEGCDFRWENDPGYVLTINNRGEVWPDNQGRRPGVYSVLGGAPNFWDRPATDRNLRPLHDDEVETLSPLERSSIMLYKLDAWMFTLGTQSPCYLGEANSVLSEADRRNFALKYPQEPSRVGEIRQLRTHTKQEILRSPLLDPATAAGLSRMLNAE